ncbi:MAG: hypothetical protein WCL61_01195 [bacterium]
MSQNAQQVPVKDIRTIVFVSQHPLSETQMTAIEMIHGSKLLVKEKDLVFESTEDLLEFLKWCEKMDVLPYLVVEHAMACMAARSGYRFGIFKRDYTSRHQPNGYALQAVYINDRDACHEVLRLVNGEFEVLNGNYITPVEEPMARAS